MEHPSNAMLPVPEVQFEADQDATPVKMGAALCHLTPVPDSSHGG